MSKPERTCYIHIGTHKTGTTSIQVFLGANRDRFAAAGVCFPLAGEPETSDVIHHDLAHELKAGNAETAERCQLAALRVELSQTVARVACLSSEDFSFLWNDPAALTRLRDTILSTGFSPQIIVYLRPQASYCTAVYAEMVRQGYLVNFARYFADVVKYGNYVWGAGSGPPFDYDRLLAGFAAVFGTDAIVAQRYQTGSRANDLLFGFARLLLPPNVDLTDFHVSSIRENGSLDFGSVLRLLGATYDTAQRIRFSPLSLLQTVQLWQRFRAANDRVAARFALAVPAFEVLDLAFAMPFRRSRAKMRALATARRTLGQIGQQGVLTRPSLAMPISVEPVLLGET